MNKNNLLQTKRHCSNSGISTKSNIGVPSIKNIFFILFAVEKLLFTSKRNRKRCSNLCFLKHFPIKSCLLIKNYTFFFITLKYFPGIRSWLTIIVPSIMTYIILKSKFLDRNFSLLKN